MTTVPPALDLSCCRLGMAAAAVKGEAAIHYFAIAERGPHRGWFVTFPGGAGCSFAKSAERIASEGQDWLASAAIMVVVIRFEHATAAKGAAA